MSTLTVLEPVLEPPDDALQPLAARKGDLAGARLGLLDNGKPNSGAYLDLLGAVLQEAYGAEVVMRLRKPGMGQVAPAEMITLLAEHCDAVVTGVGDCAGCCVCSAHDGVVLEAAGVPTAMVCTVEFLDAARNVARTLGMSAYPFVTIDHPFGSRTAAELRELAAASRDRVAWALTSAEAAVPGPVGRAGTAAGGSAGVTCEC